jgi:hypothetical protein
MVQAYLHTACRRAIDEYPFFFPVVEWFRGDNAIILEESAWAEIGGSQSLTDDVSFGDPGALNMGKYNGDSMTNFLES